MGGGGGGGPSPEQQALTRAQNEKLKREEAELEATRRRVNKTGNKRALLRISETGLLSGRGRQAPSGSTGQPGRVRPKG